MTSANGGAHWVRAALQINPFGYVGKGSPSSKFPSEDAYNNALLDRCVALGIGLLAVTDHWCVESAAGLLQAARDRGIVALPGFEANSSEGVHLLVIFEEDSSLADVNAAIGACGVMPGCDNGTPGAPFKDILAKMTDLGALVVPAHVNVANAGMLAGRSGPPLVKMVTDPNLHAVAVTPGVPDGNDQQAIVTGRRPYERKHALAVLHADDVCHPDALAEDGATTWFKVSTPTVSALKHAVRTPGTRIAHMDPTVQPRVALRQISWTGGYLDGVTLPIATDLTALIGGRGTGKSTVIESLRYALGVEPLGSGAWTDHHAIVEHVLGAGAVVRLEVEVTTPIPRSFTVERTVPDPPIVRDASGSATNLSPLDVVGPVEIYGQHELAELAGDKTRVAAMLQRFSGQTGRTEEHEALLARLEENRGQIAKVEKQRSKLEEELADIPRLEDQVRQYDESGVAERLTEVRRLDQEEAILTEALARVQNLDESIRDFAEQEHATQLTAQYEDFSGSSQAMNLQQAITATETLATRFDELVAVMRGVVQPAEEAVRSAAEAWKESVRATKDEHAAVLRALVDAGLEPDKYLTTAKALEALKNKAQRLAGIDGRVAELKTARAGLLDDLMRHERDATEALHEAIRTANDATGGVVIVRPAPSPDREHIRSVLGKLRGAKTQIMGAVAQPDFSPRALVQAVRDGLEAMEKRFMIRGAQAEALRAAGEPLLRQLEELSVGLAVEVRLDVASGTSVREYRSMDDLSKGQRATALLLLLLGASAAPLVIDQPEDDLDNRFVYDGVVSKLRELKGARQIITSTHNANVPVLGDAELIVALEGNGRRGRPITDGVGSLDDRVIRALVENILEGGPAAFNARKHLYGF